LQDELSAQNTVAVVPTSVAETVQVKTQDLAAMSLDELSKALEDELNA